MIQDLSISYSWWFILLVLAIGMVYASLLYLWNRKSNLSPPVRISLFIVRFLSTALLSFLLLSPLLKSKIKRVEKPVIIFASDNSRSVLLGKDSVFYRSEFPDAIQEIQNKLSEGYQVDTYLFGEQVRPGNKATYNDTYTDYSGIFRFLPDEYAGRNVGAVIIAGDGISNRGIDPEFAMAGFNWPVYAIAMGDTTRQQDLILSDIRYNSIVYLDDTFPLEVRVSATGLSGKTSSVNVFAFGDKVATRSFNISNDNFSQTFKFQIKALKKGKQRISVSIPVQDKELTGSNNTRNVFVDILDNRQRILVLGHGPHPDLGAIKSSLETSKNYELEIATFREFSGKIDGYDLVILHQLPSRRLNAQTLLNQLKDKKVPLLFLLGKQSQVTRFDRYFNGLSLKSSPGNFENARFRFNPSFSKFSFEREDAEMLENLPPLIVPFGSYQVAETADVLGYQVINNIPAEIPLILFNETDDHRTGLIAGEGLWLWRIQSYLLYGHTEALDALLSKSAQYLMARKDKRFFRIISDGEYSSNSSVILKAELFNASYELVNEPDVNLVLTNEGGEKFNYLFSPEGQAYTLDMDRLPEGIYRYSGSTALGNDRYSANGEFIVTEQTVESRNLRANHPMLFRIAEKHDGKMLYPSEADSIPELLSQRSDLRNKIFYEERYMGLQTLFWIFLLTLLLLSLEWFVRKYTGGY
ncbi:MAG: hypothetical protein P8100_06580 [bacterium]